MIAARGLVLISLLTAVSGAPGQAAGGEALPEDRASVEACLAASGISARGCIGTVAVVCARQAMNEGMREDIGCAKRETAVWRDRLEVAARALGEQVAAESGARLAELQKLAGEHMTKKCTFFAEMAPPLRADRIEAQCTLRETALRALEFERLLRRRGLSDAGPEFGADADR